MSEVLSIPVGAAIALASAHVLGLAGLVKWIIAREVGHLSARLKSIEEQGAGMRKEVHDLQLDLARNYWNKGEVQDAIRRLSASVPDFPPGSKPASPPPLPSP